MFAVITLIGFMFAYGAVGTMDADPSASVVVCAAIAFAGLVAMYIGVMGMNGAFYKQDYFTHDYN